MLEASKLCSYDQEYLSLLARRGQLRAEKIGKKWHTNVEWLNEYLEKMKPGEVIVPRTEKMFKGSNLSIILPVTLATITVLVFVFVAYENIFSRIAQIEERTNQARNYTGVSINQEAGGFFDFFKKESMEF